MSRFGSALILAFCITWVAACASTSEPLDDAATGGTQIEFIDLDIFDRSMTRDLRRETDVVVVRFPNQPVTVNELPDRLQMWLSAVHQHGHGLTVETKTGYVEKNILSLVGVLISGYKLVKKNQVVTASKKYKAVITLDNTDGAIEKVEFVRI